ncbi:cortical protein marker for cell polarity-domain-containing protein [Rhypophila decipiens]|uniref:Cortical protein marker for cell polarity-domain-containing protein n=1 Tax=Rhypophila decipiens TaxID=261697 RepID=A0AAN6YAB3_9PEZI|nr:cortical protein marker for cell polarity-domain-containing protein [Rhypophila decipiens]
MRLPFQQRCAARRQPFSPISLLTFLSTTISSATAVTFTPVPAANIDLSQLGRVALAGDFSGISLYQFEGQTELPYNENGPESLLARMPNGVFAPVATTDATIQTMCTFTRKDGTKDGVIIGGNFTSVRTPGKDGAQETPAVARFNPETSEITSLAGLSGQVNAVLCDQDTDTVYVGGSFVGANSTNALAWVGSDGWTNLPFAGFNGPVTSITKASNGNIIFGGSFTGLGNASTPSTPDGQVINLSTAEISGQNSATSTGFSDPKSIVCTDGAGGAGKTWLLQDGATGSWRANFNFGFQPTKLRLYNTRQDGRSTKTWRFTALPDGGIMNLTYIDPATNRNASCTSQCPLSNDPSVKFQDFHFVNIVGMNSFRIDISDFYGAGGGLNGIELFQDDIFTFAINDFNEPTCAGLPFGSAATQTGPWTKSPSQSSTSEYLTAELSGPITEESASIVFRPDIRESGHYSVNLYTPGCLQDNTCSTRGQVRLTGKMTANPSQSNFEERTLYQTNDFDKYDQIYFGRIDATSDGFRPEVTMTPLPGQPLPTMTFVAQRVGFTLINSTGNLNGLYEYVPGQTFNASDLNSSAFNRLGASFSTGSTVNSLATSGDVTYIAGNFTSKTVRNIAAMNGNNPSPQSLNGGLNGEVESTFLNGTNLFVGGSFSKTLENSVEGLNNVAVYDTSKNSWGALGAGVNGKVFKVVGLTMNITSTTPEVVVSVNGEFTELQAFGGNPAVPVDGFAIWVPSQANWLQNLKFPVESLNGVLSASLLEVSGESLYAGALSSSTLGASGIATLRDGTLGSFPVNIRPSATSTGSSGVTKRDETLNSTSSGVLAGIFDTTNGRNLTVIGGHFTSEATDGSTIHNLLIIDGADGDKVSGLPSNISSESTFAALAVVKNILFAGGKVTGTVEGTRVNALISYDLSSKSFNVQPPSLTGGGGELSSIAVRKSTGDVYVGGSFTSAGSLGCPGVCFFSTASSQWNQAGQNIAGTVNSLMWTSDTLLLAGGNLTVNGTVSTFLAQYDAGKQTWDTYPGGRELPGPVRVLTAGASDGSQIWVTGTASTGSVYLMKYDGSAWKTAGQSLEAGTDIRGLQIFSTTSSHDSSDIIPDNEVLMLTGSVVLPKFGSASAVTYDGKAFQPYALTTNVGNTAGILSRFFTEQDNFFKAPGGSLPLGFIVLIALGISLFLMVLIVVAGLFLDKLRKKREGYIPAPTSMYDRGSGIQRIPPHELLESLGKGRPGAPHV